MLEVQSFPTSRLHNSEWREISVRVLTILFAAFGPEGNKASNAFKKAADDYAGAMDQIPDSASLQRIDLRNDRLWYGLKYELKAGEYAEDAERAAANAEVKAIFDRTPNPTALPYHKEYGEIAQLLSRLEAIAPETLKRAHADGWVASMRQAYNDWQAEVAQMAQNQSTKTKGAVLTARKALEEAWHVLCHRLESMADLDENAAAEKAIGELNVLCNKIRRALKARKNDADLDLDQETDGDAPN